MIIKCRCGKDAKWLYMPGKEKIEDDSYCEDCVSRGCSCNEYYTRTEMSGVMHEDEPEDDAIEGKDWRWISHAFSWEELDGEGRQLPCCEYWYYGEGIKSE